MNIRLTLPVLVLASVFSLLLVSCSTGTNPSGKPRSTGTTSEILIVTGSRAVWNGSVGDTIRKWFSQPIPAIPQPEPMFDMLNISRKDLNDLYQKFHNILIVQIGQDTAGPAVSESMENIWSTPQRVITVKAADEAAFFEEFNKNKKEYLRLFNQLERKRIDILNQMSVDIALQKKVADKFGLFLNLPGGFYVATEAPGFMWLRHTVVKSKQDVELGILIYTTDYQDTLQFSPNYILNWRNLQTRQYVPGPSEGSFMTVSSDFIPPVIRTPDEFPMDYTMEIRGLWKVNGDFMGGPFINFTFLDQKNNRIVTIDGYVYNPNEFKRNYLRQLESIFYTLKMTD